MKLRNILVGLCMILVHNASTALTCQELAENIDVHVRNYQRGRSVHSQTIARLEEKLNQYDLCSKPWRQAYERIAQLKKANIALRMDLRQKFFDDLHQMAVLNCNQEMQSRYHDLFMDLVTGLIS